MEDMAGLAEIVGPIGVLVVIAIWAIISRRHGNGRAYHDQVVLTKLDGLRDDIGEVKTDVRDLRAGVVRHLEDHANS